MTYIWFELYFLLLIVQLRLAGKVCGPLESAGVAKFNTKPIIIRSSYHTELTGTPATNGYDPIWYDYVPTEGEMFMVICTCGLYEHAEEYYGYCYVAFTIPQAESKQAQSKILHVGRGDPSNNYTYWETPDAARMAGLAYLYSDFAFGKIITQIREHSPRPGFQLIQGWSHGTKPNEFLAIHKKVPNPLVDGDAEVQFSHIIRANKTVVTVHQGSCLNNRIDAAGEMITYMNSPYHFAEPWQVDPNSRIFAEFPKTGPNMSEFREAILSLKFVGEVLGGKESIKPVWVAVPVKLRKMQDPPGAALGQFAITIEPSKEPRFNILAAYAIAQGSFVVHRIENISGNSNEMLGKAISHYLAYPWAFMPKLKTEKEFCEECGQGHLEQAIENFKSFDLFTLFSLQDCPSQIDEKAAGVESPDYVFEFVGGTTFTANPIPGITKMAAIFKVTEVKREGEKHLIVAWTREKRTGVIQVKSMEGNDRTLYECRKLLAKYLRQPHAFSETKFNRQGNIFRGQLAGPEQIPGDPKCLQFRIRQLVGTKVEWPPNGIYVTLTTDVRLIAADVTEYCLEFKGGITAHVYFKNRIFLKISVNKLDYFDIFLPIRL